MISNAINIDNNSAEIEESKAHTIVEIIDYNPNAMVSKTVIKKTTVNVTVFSFDAGIELEEKTSPFDNYIQTTDGTGKLTIRDKDLMLNLGEGVIIPSRTKHHFIADVQFKMISTVIKSGYED